MKAWTLMFAALCLGATACLYAVPMIDPDVPDAATGADAGPGDSGGDGGADGGGRDAGNDAGSGRYRACAWPGGLDHLQISRQSGDTEVSLALAAPGGLSPYPGVSVPAPWTLNNAARTVNGQGESAVQASGTITFSSDAGLYPPMVSVHLTLVFPQGAQERLDADDVVVLMGCSPSGSAGWSSVTGMPGLSSHDLNAVWAASKGEAWAVGASNTVLRWDGSRWSPEGTPISAMVSFDDIWGVGPGQAWVAGNHQNGGFLMSSKGGWFGGVVLPNPTSQQVHGVWASSASDVWAVGGRANTSTAASWHGVDGGFTSVTTPAPKQLLGVRGRASNDVWAVVESGELLHWNGSQWALVSPGPWARLTGGIWPHATGQVWLTGSMGKLHRYSTAGGWTSVTIGGDDFFDVWGDGSGLEGWAVGANGRIASFGPGYGWIAVQSPTAATLTGVHGTAWNDVWAVGRGGVVLHYSAGQSGDLCDRDSACQVGLKCCYPCGQAGCHDVCAAVPDGGCPMPP